MFRRRPAPTPMPPTPPPVVPIRFLDDEPAPPKAPPAPPKVAPAPPAPPAPPRRREFPIGVVSFAAVVGTGLYLAGATPFRRVDAEEKVNQSFSVPAAPRVVVETFNGPITMERGEPGRVECEVIKHASGGDAQVAASNLAALDVSITRDGDTIRVVARRPEGAPLEKLLNQAGASVRLRVPGGAAAQLGTHNGGITVTGVEGPIQARSSNGKVDIHGGAGVLDLRTSNGKVAVEAADAVVTAHTSNGPIEFRGTLAPGSSTFETSNGRVTLKLPPGAHFALDARTSNGKVDADFGLNAGRGPKAKHLVATVGDDPKARVKVRTSNGTVKIEED